MGLLPSEEPSADQVMSILESAATEAELRAAIGVAAAFLRAHAPDEKMMHSMAALLKRAEAADVRFGRPHEA